MGGILSDWTVNREQETLRIIAVINQKGGVGKTTTTANLAHALVLNGYRVTVIDLDPQGHLGASLGFNRQDVAAMGDVLMHGTSVTQCVIEVREGLQLIPAGNELGMFEQRLNGTVNPGMLLRKALEGQFEDQDYVLIDCPPASGLLVVNALFCTHEVLVPVAGDYLSLQGLSYLTGTFKNFERKLGHEIRMWLVLTRYHKRRRLPEEIMEKLLQYFPKRVFPTRIRETAALAECPSFGQTIFEYRKNSNAAHDYFSLATDLIEQRTT